jgi:DNA topoisomerase-1
MFKLYQLIWQRFVACQMESAVFDTLSVDVTGTGSEHTYLFRASGSSVKFPGFLVVYEEAGNEDVKTEEEAPVVADSGGAASLEEVKGKAPEIKEEKSEIL